MNEMQCVRKVLTQAWAWHPGFVVLILLLAGQISAAEPAGPSLSSIKSSRETLRPLHKKMGPVQPGDWLKTHPEVGQSFEQYLRAQPVTPTGKRRTIYLLPVGAFSEKQEEIVRLTGEYLSLCYNRPVKSLPAIPLSDIPVKAQRLRPGSEAAQAQPRAPFPLDDLLPVPLGDAPEAKRPDAGEIQILTTYLLDDLMPKRLPEDGAALIALTASDLWPGPGWNFVFGQASLQDRVGVWSISRNGNPARNEDEYRLCLRRTLKTAAHELGHMFTIEHCTAYECNMCGSNSRSESDRRPLAFCPECSAKIWWATHTQPSEHFRKLAEFCAKHGLEEDAKFYKHSAAALSKQ
ncbi:MAG: archaemetzincin [Planctomycetes bacterium]|nr:archaemetzincin [Planctomycetota bacterium]